MERRVTPGLTLDLMALFVLQCYLGLPIIPVFSLPYSDRGKVFLPRAFGIRLKRLYINHALHVQLWVDGRGLAVLKVVLDVMIYLHGKHQL
jgi:hypothetical protein